MNLRNQVKHSPALIVVSTTNNLEALVLQGCGPKPCMAKPWPGFRRGSNAHAPSFGRTVQIALPNNTSSRAWAAAPKSLQVKEAGHY